MKPLSDVQSLFIITAGLMILCVICVAPVSGIRVTGTKYMNSLSPGDIVFHNMTVSIGANDTPMDMMVDVWGFGQTLQKSYSSIKPADDTSPYSARSLITLSSPSFHLNPGESKEITATIAVPNNVGDGGRYALISIHNAPVGNGTMAIVTSVSVPVLITIARSNLLQTGKIDDLTVGDIVPGQPIRFTTSFKNTGNVHYYSTKNIVNVTDSAGKEVAGVATEPSGFAIIPTYTVNYDASLGTDLPPGTYTATSKVSLQDGTVLDTKTTSFVIQANYIPPLEGGSVKLTSRNGGVLTTSDGRVIIDFPAGAVFSDTDVMLKPVAKDQSPAASAGMALASTSFKVDGINGLLAKDAIVTVKYTSADLDAAKSDVSKLVLARYDDSESKWTILPTTLDKSALTLSTATNRFGSWAIMVSSGGNTQGSSQGSTQGSSVSTAEGGSKLGIGLDTFIVIGALGLMIVFVGIYRSRKQ
jgi:hypothetical protein